MLDTRKAQELDLVEVLEDFPEYDIKSGEIGVIVEVFDKPSEAYDLEFVDESGTSSRFAYSVKPNQIRRVDEPTREPLVKTTKAKLLDIVELTEDLPEFGLQKGERGAVVVAFDHPDEAYDLEFVDESGKSRFAYAVKPSQIVTIDEIAKETFEKGTALLNAGFFRKAKNELKKAVALQPIFINHLLNAVIEKYANSENWPMCIFHLQFIHHLSPDNQLVRNNWAGAYVNYGVQEANKGNMMDALNNFYVALGITSSEDIINAIRENLASVYITFGTSAFRENQHLASLGWLVRACEVWPNSTSKHNLGLAYAFLGNDFLRWHHFQDAKIYFEWAESTGIMFPELIHNHGVALAGLGELDEAIEKFERALEMMPGNKAFEANLNKVLEASAGSGVESDLKPEEIKAKLNPAPPLELQELKAA